MAERSSRPVAEKLGVKTGERAMAVNTPEGLQSLLGKAFITQTGAPRSGTFDLVLYFATDASLLGKDLPHLARALEPRGRLWIAYPKGKAVATDLNRDTLRAFLEGRKWKAVALVAIDDLWAAVRFKPASS